MKDLKKVEEICKKLWLLYKASSKQMSASIKIDGVIFIVKYTLCQYWDTEWKYDVDEVICADAAVNKFINKFECEDVVTDRNEFIDRMVEVCDKSEKEFIKLRNQLELYDDDIYRYDMYDMFRKAKTFESFWKTFKEQYITFSSRPKEATVRLNGQYRAKIVEGVNDVEVGCQRIPIDAVRTLINQWDALNPQTN